MDQDEPPDRRIEGRVGGRNSSPATANATLPYPASAARRRARATERSSGTTQQQIRGRTDRLSEQEGDVSRTGARDRAPACPHECRIP